MSGWAWFLAIIIGANIVLTPFMVGRRRTPLTPGEASVLIALYSVELYALLRVAGVLS